ncbi:hypothetical protein K439DRAFT_1618780 [Ramaria rubella]|nr:hypothetical protein K439DRAFT_1618780 [Ramaria rubella]
MHKAIRIPLFAVKKKLSGSRAQIQVQTHSARSFPPKYSLPYFHVHTAHRSLAPVMASQASLRAPPKHTPEVLCKCVRCISNPDPGHRGQLITSRQRRTHQDRNVFSGSAVARRGNGRLGTHNRPKRECQGPSQKSFTLPASQIFAIYGGLLAGPLHTQGAGDSEPEDCPSVKSWELGTEPLEKPLEGNAVFSISSQSLDMDVEGPPMSSDQELGDTMSIQSLI